MPSTQGDDGVITIRTHRPEDVAHVMSRHGVLYADEFGWDPQVMEGLVDNTCADFLNTYDPSHERFWIAERHQDGQVKFAGSVMVLHDKDDPAHKSATIRLLLVEPSERGKGLGTRLVRQVIEFAREEARGYRRVMLWMPSEMAAARRIYQREGFEKVAEIEHEVFGKKSTAESWGLNF
ncbi:family transcriptional regulator [Diplodia corticola]|uniref:Family transcriptional regulator n=1 Tax=Diplodia corticola TaxID=236234 RepID=A0A1J9QVF7_9PEZI|nr:family transcriptional regulator [Diplodia corticola]OJD32966.1 family transcriptional regulator [Diplodia corticola]